MDANRTPTVYDCSIVELPRIVTGAGHITPVTGEREIPFEIKRVYYLYDVPGGAERGGHAHLELRQLIVAASGSFDVTVDDSRVKRTFTLNRPYYGLLMPRLIWRELQNFSSGGICLVLASEPYSESDYIRSYDDFKTMRAKLAT